MKERSHSKIRRQIQWSVDGRLTPSQQQALEAHLAGCAECRLYAAEIRTLEKRLSSVSVTRLAPPKPRAAAQQVAAIQASYRRYTTKRNILSVAGALAAFAIVAVLIVLAGRIVPRPSSHAVAPTETTILTPFPTITLQPIKQTDQQAITEAEAQVGYPLKTLASLPAGYVFSRVEINLPTNSVCVVYEYTRNDGPGPEMWLAQGPVADAPGLVPQPGFTDAQQIPVSLGGADEAYSLSGMVRAGEWACVQSQSGLSSALRLTWQTGSQQFDLYAMGGKCMMEEGLTGLDLLRLAEGVTGVVSHAADELDLECSPHQLIKIVGLAGYFARLPRTYPGGLEPYGASYSDLPAKEIGLYLRLPNSNHTGLWIRQMPVNQELGNDLASQYDGLPAGGYQLLTIAGEPAVMILGAWTTNEQGEKTWYQEPGLAPTLWFESDGLLINISGPWLSDGGGNPQEQLIAVAESLVYIDVSIATAVDLAGFKPKLPSIVYSGMFSRAGYDGTCALYLFYNSNDGEQVDIRQAPLSCSTDSLFERYQQPMWEGSVESATVMDHPALYIQGCMDGSGAPIQECTHTQTLLWQADGLEYVIWSTLPDSSVKNKYIEIAESLADVDLTVVGVPVGPQNQPLRYFTRAERNVRPHEQLPWQSPADSETPSPDAELITDLTVAEAEQLAGFDVWEPVGMSRFLNFEGVVFDPQRNVVTIDYGINFSLREERFQFSEDCDGCGMVGDSAVVETVQVGAVTGEYVEGVWSGTDCCGWVWEPTPFIKRLRWQANDIAFELIYHPTHDPEAVTLADLIAIAESLASENSRPTLKTSIGEFAYISARLVYEIEDVKVKADPGFKILLVVLAYPDESLITSDTLDLNNFDAAQREADVYILGDDGSQTIYPMIGFMKDGYTMGFVVPETLTSYQLVWPGNNPISIFPEQTVESPATSYEKPPFDLIEPAWLPSGYQLSGSTYYTPTNAACLIYRSPQDGPWSSMVLAQSPALLPSIETLRAPFYSDPNDESPSPYVETVPIGGAVGEQGVYYVQNIFDASQVCGGGRRPLAQALYWQYGETYFVILSNPAIALNSGNTTRMEMRRMAESITGVSTIPADTVDPERMLTIQTAENLLGHDFLETTFLPPEYDFTYTSYFERDNSRWLLMAFTNDLHILVELDSGAPTLEEEYSRAPEYDQQMTVRGMDALYSPGICMDVNGNTYTENCDTPQSLTWFENGLRYRIEGDMTKEMLIAIAEGMR